jgi:hypothetical protein
VLYATRRRAPTAQGAANYEGKAGSDERGGGGGADWSGGVHRAEAGWGPGGGGSGRGGAGVGVQTGSGVGGGDGGRGAHGGGADRARQAAAADAGRQRRAAGPGAKVPGLLRLRRAHRAGRGGALALARQRHRRHPVLPLRRPQLLAQGSSPSRARKPLPCFL